MAENAEITANADSVKTLDFGRITSATTTFAIPPTGLISREIWALIGNLNLQGLTGVSSGIATGHEEKETEEERDNRKAREKLSLALLQIELDRMIEALRTKIEDTEKLIIILEEEIKDLLQVKEEIASTLKEFKSKLEENRQARTDIDKLYDRYNTGLHKMLPAAAHDNLDFLLQKEREFITVRAELLGIDGPRRYIVFKDDEGRYYINDPHTQEKLLIDDLPQTQMKLFGETLEGKRFSMMGDIRMQEAQGRKLGNQTTLKDAESFYAGQEELARDLGKMGEGTVNTVFGYRDTLRYLEIERFKLDQDREQIERQIKIYEDKLSENARELSGKETELAETRGKLAELKQRLNEFTERKELLDRQIEATQNMNAASGEKIKSMFNEAARLYDDGKGLSFEAISKQLEQNDTSNGKILSTIAMQMFEVHQSALEKRAEQAQVQQNTSQIDEAMNAFASRHEFLQSLYGEGPGQWALDNLADWMIEAGALTADDKVQKAWENPITLDGKGVYRDNKTLKLYTYDETTETRTYIENPVIIAELYKRANVDGDLFMNETPNSEDAENGFVDTFRALLAADELRKAIKSVEITAKFNALNAQTEAAALAQKHGVDIKFPAARHEDAGQLSSTYNKDVIPSQNTEIAITEQDVNQRPTTSPAS